MVWLALILSRIFFCPLSIGLMLEKIVGESKGVFKENYKEK